MMDNERGKFLTEAIGGCWHEKASRTGIFYACDECGGRLLSLNNSPLAPSRTDFSTPEGFFRLKNYLENINKLELFFEWHVSEKRKAYFGSSIPCRVEFSRKCLLALIKTPDRFAISVYEFLKEVKQ